MRHTQTEWGFYYIIGSEELGSSRGKGEEEAVCSGENCNNKQQSSVLSAFSPHLALWVHQVIFELRASTPTPLSPCLHVVAAASFAARWSLTSLCVYDTTRRINKSTFLPNHLCWSNDQTNFVTLSFCWNVSSLVVIKVLWKHTCLLPFVTGAQCSRRLCSVCMRDEIHCGESQTEPRQNQRG